MRIEYRFESRKETFVNKRQYMNYEKTRIEQEIEITLSLVLP